MFACKHPVVGTANKRRKCAANGVLSTGISVITVQKDRPIGVWTEVLHLRTFGWCFFTLHPFILRRKPANNRMHFDLTACTSSVNFRYPPHICENFVNDKNLRLLKCYGNEQIRMFHLNYFYARLLLYFLSIFYIVISKQFFIIFFVQGDWK